LPLLEVAVVVVGSCNDPSAAKEGGSLLRFFHAWSLELGVGPTELELATKAVAPSNAAVAVVVVVVEPWR
jgi:hypothetical protein